MTENYQEWFNIMRRFFSGGATLPYDYRRRQLVRLGDSVRRHEQEIYAALQSDLKKSSEEAFATEVGLLLAEINRALRNLRQWMRPQSANTNLVNFPSWSKIYRQPLGVVLIIAPWNYPLQLALIPLVGAIAAGNCVVLKPSELAPATAAVVEKIVTSIFPTEYARVLQGEGGQVIPAAMGVFRFDHIFFTGSGIVGQKIYGLAARQTIPVTLELGGKSPVVVEADARLWVTARRISVGKFANAGQTCVAPDYLLVDERIKAPLVEALKATISRFFGSDPALSRDYCKIINEKIFDRLVGYLQQGNILWGGQHDRSKLYIAPTIMEGVPADSPLMQEEIFGPILPVYGVVSPAEALAMIEKNPHPLSFYVFTGDRRKVLRWIEQISFGGGCINNACWHFTNPSLPFGGVASSGLGSYHGKFSFDRFTHPKAVMKTATWFDPDLKYPPFSGKLSWFKLLIR